MNGVNKCIQIMQSLKNKEISERYFPIYVGKQCNQEVTAKKQQAQNLVNSKRQIIGVL